jgi:hypothetical protein
MLTPWEVERRREQLRAAALKAQALTPAHAAAEGALGAAEPEEPEGAEREARERIRHLADPYAPDAPEVAHADLGKRYDQAYEVPAGHPAPLGPVSPESFRRGPLTAGEGAYGPGYVPSVRPVPIPQATLSAAAICRPLMTDGQSRPSAPGGG